MAIWPQDRESISYDDFLALCARYLIQVFVVGNRLVVCTELTQRERPAGRPLSPSEAVYFVDSWRYKGAPILHFIASTKTPGVVAVAFTDAGRAWKRDQRAWARLINPPLPRRFRRRFRNR